MQKKYISQSQLALPRLGVVPQRPPAPFVQALARHSDLKITQRYADLDANDLREAINLLQVDENRGDSGASEG